MCKRNHTAPKYRGFCTACRLLCQRAWRRRNQVHVREYARRWREANHDKVLAYAREWRRDHADV